MFGFALAHDSASSPLVKVAMSIGSSGPNQPESGQHLRAGANTRITLKFTQDGLPLPHCRCRVLLYQGKPSARRAPLKDFMLDALQSGSQQLVIQLPSPGRYTLVLDGRPPSYGLFETFRADYPLSVKP